MKDEIAIVAASACTCVGPTAAHTAVGIALGLSGFVTDPVVHSGDLQPLGLGIVPGFSERGVDRYPWLARLALADMWTQLDALKSGGRIPLYLAVPEGVGTRETIANLKRDLENEFELKIEAVEPCGPAGVLSLIAAQASRAQQPFLVGAIDSFVDTDRLSADNVRPRLLSEKTKSGFVGGEAAVFLCVAPRAQVASFGHALNVSRIRMSAIDMDPRTLATDAFGAMLRDVAAELPPQSLDWWASDINGERYRSRAYSLALTRIAAAFRDIGATRIATPSTGDVGTANAALLLALAFVESRERESGRGLLMTSAFSGEAGACLVNWENDARPVGINKLAACTMGMPGQGMSQPPGPYKIPAPPAPFAPAMLPAMTMSSMLVAGTTTVLIGGSPAAVASSKFATCMGDQAGTLLGIMAPMVSGPCSPTSFSPNVMLNGAPAFRDTDQAMMNQGNSICPAFKVIPPLKTGKSNDDPIVSLALTLNYTSDVSVPTEQNDSSYWGGHASSGRG